MKRILLVVLIFASLCNTVLAQINPEKAQTGEIVELLFPEGKSKALILSYDDGRTEDRQLVQLMNKYALKGTFHLNSNKLGSEGYLNRSEIKRFSQGMRFLFILQIIRH
jgi:peptidoglycan-N-acetylglucosamine deacetylase